MHVSQQTGLLCCSMHFVETDVNRTTGNCSRGDGLARWEKALEECVSHAVTSMWQESVKTALESPTNLKSESLQPELKKQILQMRLGLSCTQTGRKGVEYVSGKLREWWFLWCQTLNENCLREAAFSRRLKQAHTDIWALKNILPSTV